eukprot:TRINITY_DN2161_c0_g1_i1.p1 TRINITY_DN2161_c0_g1~~TRINITY_DN2161_c0_g1_i1.p1  ORF type:complete len:669 (+),score=247.33 TRINITY_DN2161_c0_g1_i1:93-2009(+)
MSNFATAYEDTGGYGYDAPAGGATSLKRQQSETTTVEDDEAQMRAYDELIDLLLAAGYFRARIATLSPFDRVIGGLTWCILNSQVELDVDLFFQEEANIGFQIKLGEKIEKSLARMRCPYPLQSHQIRGLDYISIFPVVRWLVARVIEVREETGDLLRVISESVFGREYTLPEDAEFEERKDDASYFVKGVAYRYRPSRQYRKRGGHDDDDEELRVQSTLLEYGHKAYTQAPSSSEKSISKQRSGIGAKLEAQMGGGAGGDAAQSEEERRAAEEKRFQMLMQGMESSEETGDVSGKRLRGLVSMDGQADEIRKLDEELDSTMALSQEGGALSGKQYEEEVHNRQVESLTRQIESHMEILKSFVEPHKELRAQLQELQDKVDQKAGVNHKIETELEKFQAMVTDENKDDIAQLRALLILNESLKKQEEQFREDCKVQLTEMKARIEQLQNMAPSEEEQGRRALIQETHEKDSEKTVRYRQALAKKKRDIALVERKMDEIPSRSELQQYQSQFMELYEQVAVKLIETRKYYQMYNTLDDTLTFLSKEISILNSIHDNWKTAMKGKSMKEKFLEQLGGIVGSVDNFMKKTEDKLEEHRDNYRAVSSQYNKLVERERAFIKATKEFQEECTKNRQLQERLGQ